MEITITLPSSIEEHLRTYAASLLYETTPYAISRAVVSALINQLDSAGLVIRAVLSFTRTLFRWITP